MDTESLETRFPHIVDEYRVADATFMQLRECQSTGNRMVVVRMAEWLVGLDGLDSHQDLERCAAVIGSQEREARQNGGHETPSQEEVEVDRDAVTSEANDIINRLALIAQLLTSELAAGGLSAKSSDAIANCQLRLENQRQLLRKHADLVKHTERLIVLSRAKLALCDGKNQSTEAELVSSFDLEMRKMRAKRFALIDEKCAIAEQERAIEELAEQLVNS